jgi:polynucleotide 5'-kinase involved in rRNA processing
MGTDLTHTYNPTQAVTARPSLSGLNRDADVWEEDTLPAPPAEEEEEKPRLSLVVIGHVDAGKSTLMGQVIN